MGKGVAHVRGVGPRGLEEAVGAAREGGAVVEHSQAAGARPALVSLIAVVVLLLGDTVDAKREPIVMWPVLCSDRRVSTRRKVVDSRDGCYSLATPRALSQP